MKKLFLSLIVVLFAFSAVGQERFDAETTDGCTITYEVTSGNTVKVYAFSQDYEGAVTIPSIVTNDDNEYTVTAIGIAAGTGGEESYGQNNQNLTSVVIPNTVEIIDLAAFFNCHNLSSVTFQENSSLKSIGELAFAQCSDFDLENDEYGLASIVIPEGVISIGAFAFAQNFDLTTVTLPSTLVELGDDAFAGCPTLSSVTFAEGTQLTYLPNTVFMACRSLTEITIPASITSIGWGAFQECESLNTITLLGETAPSLEEINNDINEVFIDVPVGQIHLIVPESSDYSSWKGCAIGSINSVQYTHLCNYEGDIIEIDNEFVINENTIVYNNGIIVIKNEGELIIEDDSNDLGIVEVSTDVLPNDKWSFIGAPFAGYKLEAILPGTHDISISEFNYANGAWSNDWATIETEIGAGEGFFAWSWAEESTIFTNYGDVWDYENNQIGGYDYSKTPEYQINTGDVDVTKTLGTHDGHWMALANPYTFKLDVAKFIADQNNSIQGEVFYRLNDDNVWQTATTGAINLTEGFFVNFVNAGENTAHFKTTQRYTSSAKSNAEREFVRLAMLEGEREIELLFAQNEQANEEYDIFDANKLFSPVEIAEPYFVTNNIALVKEEVNTLPYYATMNVRSFGNKEVKFKANYIPEGLSVSIIDGEETIDLAEGVEYTTNIVAGENADRFKVLIKKSLSLEEAEELQVNIFNNNRHINIETLESDIQVEVYNALGQKVFTTRDHNFALNNVPAGAYLIKAFNANASKTAKVIVK